MADADFVELVVVGAGPCGLAVVSRLARDARCGGTAHRERARRLLERTRVVDPSGCWLAEWRRKLGSQGVTHLRSPTFVHPHPSRVVDDALRAYAAAGGRLAELAPLSSARAWSAPSAGLFEDFCAAVAREFCAGPLEDCLMRARVLELRAGAGGGFEIDLEGGAQLRARRVVLALGDGGLLRVPSWLPAGGEGVPRLPSPPLLHASHLAAAHEAAAEPRGALRRAANRLAWRLACALAARPRWLPVLRALLRWTARGAVPPPGDRLVIVGGGLSGAQLALHAARRGWASVELLLRADAAVRPFDIDEEWMARHHAAQFSPLEQRFYRASPPHRRELLAAARPGGSVTPGCVAQLAALQRRGGLRVRRAEVEAAEWRAAEGCWELRLRGEAGAMRADALWLATGHELDAARLPLLRSAQRAWPQPMHGGLPELTPSLRWREGCELYCAGALSALQIGPDAFNLAGCAAGAARIASAILGDEVGV